MNAIVNTANLAFLLMSTFGFAAIGALDDSLKVHMQNTDGLKPLQKMAGILIVSVILLMMLPNQVRLNVPVLGIEIDNAGIWVL